MPLISQKTPRSAAITTHTHTHTHTHPHTHTHTHTLPVSRVVLLHKQSTNDITEPLPTNAQYEYVTRLQLDTISGEIWPQTGLLKDPAKQAFFGRKRASHRMQSLCVQQSLNRFLNYFLMRCCKDPRVHRKRRVIGERSGGGGGSMDKKRGRVTPVSP